MSEQIMAMFKRLNGTVKSSGLGGAGYNYCDNDIGTVRVTYYGIERTEEQIERDYRITQSDLYSEVFNMLRRQRREWMLLHEPDKYKTQKDKRNAYDRQKRAAKKNQDNH